jgi:plasmid stabilization system protein ParE
MPEQYRVILVAEAFEDLNRTLDHIKEESPQNAVQTLDRLWSACQSLTIFPRRHKIHQNRKASALTVHSMPAPPFIVYYRVDDNVRTVRVISIRHGARKQPARFK